VNEGEGMDGLQWVVPAPVLSLPIWVKSGSEAYRSDHVPIDRLLSANPGLFLGVE
jgi:hypothetical protein